MNLPGWGGAGAGRGGEFGGGGVQNTPHFSRYWRPGRRLQSPAAGAAQAETPSAAASGPGASEPTPALQEGRTWPVPGCGGAQCPLRIRGNSGCGLSEAVREVPTRLTE